MTTPSNVAKAAAILYHTWGVPDALSALQIYERLDSGEAFEAVFHDGANCGIWERVDHLPERAIWNEIECLSRSIDQCREELT